MKKFITSAALLLTTSFAFAQTTATNFTANDCNSTSHTLFTELNSGQVIVMVWVMPCGSCVNPAKAAYNAVQSFATSNPGKVKLYIIDDYGDANCATLSSWITSNSIGNVNNITIFDNTGNPISMNDYGTDGMPKVVVVGGPNHQIFYNQNNSAANNQTAITSAITSALIPTSIKDVQNQISFAITPNPANEKVVISYEKAVKKVVITAVGGQVVKEENFGNGVANPTISLNNMAAGVYLIKITDSDMRTGIQKLIKQ
ncbi:MAG TPA: T9SS type A sorting domain-containing protein [Flavipsychrobacter sp.]|nr:T9SS type A sorting domain-containing protein [Flavipsychrobacter sp.]